MKKISGEKILVDQTLNTYMTLKPVHYIMSCYKINNDYFNKLDTLITTIEENIKVGDQFLYKVQKEIEKSFKYDEYNSTIEKIKDTYNIEINNNVYEYVYNSINK